MATSRKASTRKASTRMLGVLPTPSRLRDLLRGLAMLDAILEQDWDSRYYSFDPKWASGEMLGSMRNGEGDWFFAWFPAAGGAAIRGFDHESPMSPFRRKDEAPWPGLYDGLPKGLSEVRSMDGFPPEEVTFAVWNTGRGWKAGAVTFPKGEDDPDGSERLWALLDDDPASYLRFAKEYYERKLPLSAVKAIYRGEPLTRELISALDPKADYETVAQQAQEIGYPMSSLDRTPNKTAKKKSAKKAAAAKKVAPSAKAPKAPPIRGEASFKVAVLGPTVQMLVHDKPVVEFTGDGDKLYDELFDLVKAKIKERKKKASRR
ncbi:MAG TPA: hypothetical protein VM580_28905 [Labilithrix sp.]|nr:hypothetical protein [Labilithrix sp.]